MRANLTSSSGLRNHQTGMEQWAVCSATTDGVVSSHVYTHTYNCIYSPKKNDKIERRDFDEFSPD